MLRDDIINTYEMSFEERRRVLGKIREVLESLDFVKFAVVLVALLSFDVSIFECQFSLMLITQDNHMVCCGLRNESATFPHTQYSIY